MDANGEPILDMPRALCPGPGAEQSEERGSGVSDPNPMIKRGHAQLNVFHNPLAMKDELKRELNRPRYDVAIYYHKTGFTQWVARHDRFEKLTLLVIALNALWIFIDTDYNPGPMLISSPPFFQIVENLFCMYFSFEWMMRFCAFKRKRDGLKDAWFIFDSLLVAMMFFETWLMTAILLFGTGGTGGGFGNASILRMARLLRLSRMARMARLLRAMPELLILCKGMIAAMRSVGFTLSLLFVILYVFGIAFVQLCDSSPCQELFPDVPNAMHTLLLQAALMDGLGMLVEPLQKQNLALLLVLYLFVLLASLTVMNMLIGVICELVSIVANTERESLTLNFVREKVEELIMDGNADEDGDGLVSREEFLNLLAKPKAVKILHDTGVDVVGLVDLADEIFQPEDNEDDTDEKKLNFEELMEHILEQRGGNNSTVKDVQRLRKHVNSRFNALEKKLRGNNIMTGLASQNSGALMQDTLRCNTPRCETPRCETLRLSSNSSYLQTTPRLTGGFQDALTHSMHDLTTAYESEVAFLQAENLRLRDQMAKVTNSGSSNTLAVNLEYCGSHSETAHFDQEHHMPSPVLATGVAPRKSPLQTSAANGRRAPEAPATASEIRHRHGRGLGTAPSTSPRSFGAGTTPSGQSRDESVDSRESGIRGMSRDRRML